MLCSDAIIAASSCYTDNFNKIFPVFSIVISFGVFVGIIAGVISTTLKGGDNT